MADIITTSFLAPVASRFAVTGTGKLAPSALELGAETLTRNPAREAIARLFSPANNAGLLARLDTLLTAQQAAPANTNSIKNGLKSSTSVKAPQGNDLINGLFSRTETGAALRLKELLKPSPAGATTTAGADGEKPGAASPALPVIRRNAGLRVEEGGTAAITAQRLAVLDADTAPKNITYTLDDDGPRHGRLEFAAKPGEAVTSFTQEDIDLHRLRYVHNGDEISADSFRFTASDGAHETAGTFSIAIAAVNDTPEVTVNETLAVDEGAAATITIATLAARDADGASFATVFEVTAGPAHGYLEVNGDAATSFTQADLQAGRVRYVHDGSETTDDSFSFTVGDGGGTAPVQSLAITVAPVDDAPVTVTNTGATLYEGGATTLTSAQLAVEDADTAPADLTYTVTNGPTNGRLEFADEAGIAISSFTQADLDAGRVQFLHDGSETTEDSFSFTVADGTTVLQEDSFAFDVTPVDDAPFQATNNGAAVNEGASVTIGASALGLEDIDTAAGDLEYAVTAGPAHGRLEFADNAGVSVSSFTQADIDSGRLRYVHDGSETTSDSFSFTAGDATTTLGSASFAIAVNPVDDAPTLLNTGGTVAENGTHAINLNELRGTDPDTASSQLVFTVTGTTNGRVESSTAPGTAITSFTQDDIAAGRVRFVQNGAESATAGFTFSLSDGNTALAGNSFNLSVTPVNDAPVQVTNTGADVRRHQSVVLSSQLKASDADNTASQLTYSVSRAPTRGRLELMTDPGTSITSFTQAQLDAGLVRYVHTGSGTTDDSFRFRISDGTARTTSQTFNIRVQ